MIGYEARKIARSAVDVVRHRRAVRGIEDDAFWALRDVSFEVGQGDVLGIVGRNGAGKSTLLKILSRITEPTEGRARIAGRIGSLLEIGTGFHPEMTGRENIFLNGAILGMPKSEIVKKFDEIVAFAGVERFLDTPVKRYSSGMYVRLAFAVAAHLDVDILIVDEVLAVGDAEFQKKCLGKMNDARRDGRTVLLVSHNISLIRELCSKVLWLDGGRIERFGAVEECTKQYLAHAPGRTNIQAARRLGSSLELRALDIEPNPLPAGTRARIQIEINATQTTRIDELSIMICSSSNVRIAVIDLRSFDFPVYLQSGQSIAIAFMLSPLTLLDDEYPIWLFIRTSEIVANIPDLIRLRIVPGAHPSNPIHYPAGDRGFLALSLSDKSIIKTPL